MPCAAPTRARTSGRLPPSSWAMLLRGHGYLVSKSTSITHPLLSPFPPPPAEEAARPPARPLPRPLSQMGTLSAERAGLDIYTLGLQGSGKGRVGRRGCPAAGGRTCLPLSRPPTGRGSEVGDIRSESVSKEAGVRTHRQSSAPGVGTSTPGRACAAILATSSAPARNDWLSA